MSNDEKRYVTTTKDYIAVKPDGHVVICRQDMHTGEVRVMPLMVDLDGMVRVVENTQTDGGQNDGTAYWKTGENAGYRPDDVCFQSEVERLDKLAAYEDAEEQGRLVILPCKVGDVIWWKNGHRIVDCHVIEIQISEGRSEVIFRFGPQLNLKAGARFEDFGETAFLTREEAEAALKGGQDDV